MRYEAYARKLDEMWGLSRDGNGRALDGELDGWITVIVENAERAKAALAVTLTSILKKSVDPGQDIRAHQRQLENGYSGRSLDKEVTTPFLQRHRLPAPAESGWLTRSFEQNRPYTLEYDAPMRPAGIRGPFLGILDAVQAGRADCDGVMLSFLSKLRRQRELKDVELESPARDLEIREIVDLLGRHFTANYGAHGAARLPVLAVYSAYELMRGEVSRYRDCRLLDLEPHTAADARTGALGDIEVLRNDRPFEALEIKHGQTIDDQTVSRAHDKFRGTGIGRYYILTTHEDCAGPARMTELAGEIYVNEDVQLIVNGVMHTLRYYLRLLDSPNRLVDVYRGHLGSDPAVSYEHKAEWNRLVREVAS